MVFKAETSKYAHFFQNKRCLPTLYREQTRPAMSRRTCCSCRLLSCLHNSFYADGLILQKLAYYEPDLRPASHDIYNAVPKLPLRGWQVKGGALKHF